MPVAASRSAASPNASNNTSANRRSAIDRLTSAFIVATRTIACSRSTDQIALRIRAVMSVGSPRPRTITDIEASTQCHCVGVTYTATGGFTVSYTHLRAHETPEHLVCRLLLE